MTDFFWIAVNDTVVFVEVSDERIERTDEECGYTIEDAIVDTLKETDLTMWDGFKLENYEWGGCDAIYNYTSHHIKREQDIKKE